MNPFSYLKSVYYLDTLDTRFTNDSKVPYRTAAAGGIDPVKRKSSTDEPPQGVPAQRDGKGRIVGQPPLWRTPEFYVYYAVFSVVVPYMFWVVYDVSRESDPRYPKYANRLSEGWIAGRKIDISDPQYYTFRKNIPYMVALLVFHPLLRRLFSLLWPLPSQTGASEKQGDYISTSIATGQARLRQRTSFDFGFALLFLSALHGFSALKVMLILYLNYCITQFLPRRMIPIATWIFNIGILFANELSDGYQYRNVFAFFLNQPEPVKGAVLQTWGSWLDQYRGIMPRWEILFNITVLRLISYNLDYYWSLDRRAASPVEKKQLDISNLSERDRVQIPARAEDFNFRNYVAYAIYAPLYLTGPIMTYNDFISQLSYPPTSIETSRTIKYGIRFLLVLLCMEFVLHFDYCIAISKGDPDWSSYSPIQLGLLSFFSLHVLWLKLLLSWRLFRLWALVDGVDPPENMLRCVSDVPSTVSFWRGWHRSFNRWLIRYIYLPLGGDGTRGRFGIVGAAFNYLVIFTFVALWHDISLHLLIWGWLVVFFMMPEVVAGYLFPRKKWAEWPAAYRALCSLGGVGNLFMMMIANLVGFAVGVEGLKSIIHGIFHEWSGLATLVITTAALFTAVQVMLEHRQDEIRHGIVLRC